MSTLPQPAKQPLKHTSWAGSTSTGKGRAVDRSRRNSGHFRVRKESAQPKRLRAETPSEDPKKMTPNATYLNPLSWVRGLVRWTIYSSAQDVLTKMDRDEHERYDWLLSSYQQVRDTEKMDELSWPQRVFCKALEDRLSDRSIDSVETA